MIEDKLLLLKFKFGSNHALCQIYEKYAGFLLTLATALLNDVSTAEDVVHDFFVSFAQSPNKVKLEGNLKSFLATCVANRARDKIREKQRQPAQLDTADLICSNENSPESAAVCNEEFQLLADAMRQIPYEQREVIILHGRGEMTFEQIAELQNVPIKTTQSRYRYGLDKLRTILNGEVQK